MTVCGGDMVTVENNDENEIVLRNNILTFPHNCSQLLLYDLKIILSSNQTTNF